jgi:hypothetical protein
VIYSRDFSSALCDPQGNTVMQGSGDIAAHVGTLHYTAQAVINNFPGDIHPGDVFVVNDVYQGGTHFNDTRIVRPIFYKDELLGFAQANGQIDLHELRIGIGHGVERLVNGGQQLQAILVGKAVGFDVGLVLVKPGVGVEAGHAHIDTRLAG